MRACGCRSFDIEGALMIRAIYLNLDDASFDEPRGATLRDAREWGPRLRFCFAMPGLIFPLV
jgi:hypothetical protein